MPSDVPTIPGFVGAFVARNDDPEGQSRVKFRIPGLIEPESAMWAMPVAPGAGSVGKGSKYPPPEPGAPIYVIFHRGRYLEPSDEAIYLSGYYGDDALPSSADDSPTPEETNRRVVIWENETFALTVIDDDDEKKAIIQTKKGGSRVQVDGAAGVDGKSEVVSIEATTGINIEARGVVNIKGAQIIIGGRLVNQLTGGSL